MPVADTGHFALSLSRPRQCDRTHVSTTKRATVRQNFTVAVFCCTVATFCCTVALSSVLSYCRTVVGEIATVRNVRYQPPQKCACYSIWDNNNSTTYIVLIKLRNTPRQDSGLTKMNVEHVNGKRHELFQPYWWVKNHIIFILKLCLTLDIAY